MLSNAPRRTIPSVTTRPTSEQAERRTDNQFSRTRADNAARSKPKIRSDDEHESQEHESNTSTQRQGHPRRQRHLLALRPSRRRRSRPQDPNRPRRKRHHRQPRTRTPLHRVRNLRRQMQPRQVRQTHRTNDATHPRTQPTPPRPMTRPAEPEQTQGGIPPAGRERPLPDIVPIYSRRFFGAAQQGDPG